MPVNPFERDNKTMTDGQGPELAEKAIQTAGALDNTSDLLKDLKAVLEIDQTEAPAAPEPAEKAEVSAAAEKPHEDKASEQTKMIQDTVEAVQKDMREARNAVKKSAERAADAPTARFSVDEVDDENLLAELHALIGDPIKPKPIQSSAPSPFSKPSASRTPPAQRPLARITPDTLKNVPDDFEDVAEADTMGIPGWLKGLSILVLSLLLCAMIFYAVFSDVLGQAI